MPEDHSLEEFASADPGGSTDSTEPNDDAVDRVDADGDGADTDAAADATADAVNPAAPTYDHSPDGAACAACGDSVTRRWRDDSDYVCADCKEW
ncbi:DUF7573 domain-containing protein [Halobaculum gomorrense]|uniref:DUF7573 domain-containing protein n=1 Tax=Halobaculum gomorrense TaxID=43928 RepID=A0A1M5LSH1_9EURY|nr:hypothetical protein [Halobaculum gomorrense]SHG67850.1 hypothetical protein SAMN05443636_0753 [Halobaculum gomorrense]